MSTDPFLADVFTSGFSRIGFGCCPMGGHGWGPVQREELLTAVHEALNLGIRFFDTADVYGLGASETLLGEALGRRRKEAIVATKFGVRYEAGKSRFDCTPGWIEKAVDASLARLKTDYIDLYQMHYWDQQTPLGEVVLKLSELKARGKIRAFGVTNHDPLDAAFGTGHRHPVTYSYHYNMIHREHEARILDAQQRRSDLLFLSWGSLGQGILSDRPKAPTEMAPDDRRRRPDYANFHGKKFEEIQAVLPRLVEFARVHGFPTLPALALRWIIDRVPRSMPLVGIKKPSQIHEASAALRFSLGTDLLEELTRIVDGITPLPASTP